MMVQWLKPPFKAGGSGAVHGQGAKTPYAWRSESQNINQSNIVINAIMTLKWTTSILKDLSNMKSGMPSPQPSQHPNA